MAKNSRRIAVGGFQHETNTFAPRQAAYADFVRAGGWPGLTRGEAMFEDVVGINIPIAGFIQEAQTLGHELRPLSWASTEPSAHVTEDAFERIAGQIVEDLREMRDLDAVYLDLHGAMVTEHLEDGEGELLRRVRSVVGPEMPLVTSLDLHANITPEMVARADTMIAYRTYPHVDMAATGARVARHLDRLLDGAGKNGNGRQHKAFRQLPFLMQLTAGCTFHDPARGLYEQLEALEDRQVSSMSFACGFGPADIFHCGPSLVAYGDTQAAADSAADVLYDYAMRREESFVSEIWQPAEAVAKALALAKDADKPVVLADTQDNPGAGGESDTVGLLAELVRQDVPDTALAILFDPEVAAAAHAAGEGAEISVGLGSKSGQYNHKPFEATYRVEALGDGRFTGTGPFYKGARMQLGPMAQLSLRGVRIVVASTKLQAADQAIFRHVGVEPTEQRILGLKSSVHFRADFQPIAEEILLVAAPGPNLADHHSFAYKHLRPGLRIMPRGPAFAPDAA